MSDPELITWLQERLEKGECKLQWTVVEPCETVKIEEVQWRAWDRLVVRDELGFVWVSEDRGETFVRESAWMVIWLEFQHEFWWTMERWAGKLWLFAGRDKASYWLDFLPAFCTRKRYGAQNRLRKWINGERK